MRNNGKGKSCYYFEIENIPKNNETKVFLGVGKIYKDLEKAHWNTDAFALFLKDGRFMN